MGRPNVTSVAVCIKANTVYWIANVLRFELIEKLAAIAHKI